MKFMGQFVCSLACALVLASVTDPGAASTLYEQAQSWRNPPPAFESWRHGVRLEADGGLWDVALVDGAGFAEPSPHHVGSITVLHERRHRHVLSLEVGHDPWFESESDDDWIEGMAAVTRYNNAFVVGMGGWLPNPGSATRRPTEIVVSFDARWEKGYESLGTSGVWLEQQGTFDSEGIMLREFQAAGLSYTSAQSALFPGLWIEGVTGFAPDNAAALPTIVLSTWHHFEMTLGWQDVDQMRLGISVDGSTAQFINARAFGPFEIQLWRDNFLVVPDPELGFRISHMNFPEGWHDPFQLGSLVVYERPMHARCDAASM